LGGLISVWLHPLHFTTTYVPTGRTRGRLGDFCTGVGRWPVFFPTRFLYSTVLYMHCRAGEDIYTVDGQRQQQKLRHCPSSVSSVGHHPSIHPVRSRSFVRGARSFACPQAGRVTSTSTFRQRRLRLPCAGPARHAPSPTPQHHPTWPHLYPDDTHLTPPSRLELSW